MAKRHMLYPFTFILFLFFSTSALAAAYYVQTSGGNDTNPGDDWGTGHALATVAAAMAKAAVTPGADTIHVAAGTYLERVAMVSAVTLLGGYPAAGGTPRNPSANDTILDGQEGGSVVEMISADNVTLDGFTITNGSRADGCGGGVLAVNGTGVVIKNNRIIGNTYSGTEGGGGAGICIDSTIGTDIRENTISTNISAFDGGGIFAYYASSALIHENVITGNTAINWGGGLNIYHSSATAYNNVIMGNIATGHGGGISVYDSGTLTAANVTMTGNISLNTTGGGIYVDTSTVSLQNFIVWDNSPDQVVSSTGTTLTATYSDVQGGFAGTGNIALNPRFAFDPEGMPLLMANSPCIDSGTAIGAPGTDIRGMARPWGRAYDMGAYEMSLYQPQLPLLLLQ
ncbi:right-handed parallel beta-helix repeat-containing protein [Desulfolutivibrio sp.]|uniref:right-handed parallel beta-helix repeat-containing protein n=1 Tax=Desulfolutivibrio sp. TaxID=2773296 RepID=UPI002F961308